MKEDKPELRELEYADEINIDFEEDPQFSESRWRELAADHEEIWGSVRVFCEEQIGRLKSLGFADFREWEAWTVILDRAINGERRAACMDSLAIISSIVRLKAAGFTIIEPREDEEEDDQFDEDEDS